MSSDEPASKKHKTGTEDVDSFSVWRNTIPDDISENTTRDIGAKNDTTLNETFSVLQLPESLAYPHPVRACNVCYDAAKVVEMVTSYVAGTADASGTTPDDDALEVGMAKVYDLLERVAEVFECFRVFKPWGWCNCD
jgi:hypothetical protein